MSAPSWTGRRAGAWLAGVLVFVAVAALAGAGVRATSDDDRQASSAEPRQRPLLPCDALCNRVRSELRVFTDWLARWGVRGYVGEIGIPGNESADRWNALAQRWYRDADASGLWVTTWATGEWWNPGYMLATYGRSGPEGTPLDTPTSQSSVIEANLDGPGLRGVNVPAGPSTAGSVAAKHPSGFSNKTLGKLPDRHIQPESLRFLAGRGIEIVRLPFNWERLQPVLGGPLAEGELAHLREVISVAGSLGMTVVVDMHNFGGYYEWDAAAGTGVRKVIGTTLPVATFADTWARIARALGDHPNVVWDLMNEPARMASAGGRTPAQVWEQASQAAVDAIRATGDTHTITVAGYDYSSAATWTEHHDRPWVRDPLAKIRYQAHQYWDTTRVGDYDRPYAAELATAMQGGYRACTDSGCPPKERKERRVSSRP